MSFDTDSLAVFVNGFLVVALVSGVLAITAMVLLLVRGRTDGGPAGRTTGRTSGRTSGRLPEITMAQPRATATEQAA